MNVNDGSKLDALIEKYSYAPDFFDQKISDVNSRTSFGDQLLHAACVSGNLEDVAFLISMGSDINSQGGNGYTPLHYAVEQDHEEVVSFLLKKGADRLIKNFDGETPEEIAINLNAIKMVELIQLDN